MATQKTMSDEVSRAAAAAAQSGQKPTYAGTYEGQLNDIYQKIENRQPFSYDVNEDPLYQNYKDQYVQGGKLAMKDTMGQAAALTGGYGSTYGQQVGQQAYNAYLQNLSAAIPELYGMAYGRYQDEGQNLKDLYDMTGKRRDTEYGQWRDALGDWNTEVQRGLENERYEREYERQQEQETYNRAQAEKASAYANLTAAIKGSGYVPSDAELAAAGMTRQQADAMRNEFNRQVAAEEAAAEQARRESDARIANYNRPSSSGGGGGGGGGNPYVAAAQGATQTIQNAGFTVDRNGDLIFTGTRDQYESLPTKTKQAASAAAAAQERGKSQTEYYRKMYGM